MTRTQKDNLLEWMWRLKEDQGIGGPGSVIDMTAATVIFNGLDAEFQQHIIKHVWYSRTTGKPINRPLLPEVTA